jgi:branched-chain amino acid transport system substrate-binding protein
MPRRLQFSYFSSIKVVLLAVNLLVFGSSCTKKQVHSPQKQGDADVLKIGEVSSMTGAEATYGKNAHQGILLGIDEMNEAGGIKGKKLKLITLDSQGNPDESARAITKLITQEGVLSVLTGVISSNALAMAPIAQQHQIPFLATIATNPKVTDLGNFIFRTCLMDSFQGVAMAKFALQNLKMKRLVILRDIKSDYSVGLAETFASTLKSGGGEVIMEQSYSAGDIDFRAQLTSIRSKDADGIFVPGYYTDVSLIARQARELGLKAPLLGGDGWDSPLLKEIGGDALSGSYFSGYYSPDDSSPRLKSFITRYQKAYGVVPDGLALMGYEGTQLFINALKRAKTLSPKDIREAFAETKNVETVSGKISMNSHRDAARPAVVLKIEKSGSIKYQTKIYP